MEHVRGAALARAVVVLAIVACSAPVLAQDASGGAGAAPAAVAYPAPGLGPWTAGERTQALLRTPQSTLDHFLAAGSDERFEDAAAALNLTDLDTAERLERGPELARRLHFVLDRRLDVDWREVSDRPDGARDVPGPLDDDAGTGAGGAPTPRRNLLIGLVDRGDHAVEVRLERVDPSGMEPIWLVARSTIRNVDALYALHGPGWLDRIAPSWALRTFGRAPIWQWLGFVLLIGLSAGIGILLQRLASRLMSASERRWMRGLAGEVSAPLALTAGLAVLYLATTTLLTLTGPLSRWVATGLAVLSVAAVTWLGMSVINFFSEYVGKDHVDHLARRDEARARRHLTYLSVARRAFIFVVMLLGLGVVLAQFSAFRTLGTSLLASAGVVSIVLGVAAQGSLANVMAGIQIALTQLVRIGDTVYFEREWGYIEDITYTFVIIRTWDQRRIAVPNKHIISNPLENWEMTSSHLTMSVLLYVDYRTPVDEVRRAYVALLEADEEWDGEQEPDLEVTAVREDVMELRALCSGKDALAAWRLHCRLREGLVAFLRDWEDGRYLPRRRVQLQGDGAAEPRDA